MMDFYETDPEFMERMKQFTFEEVVKETNQELPEDAWKAGHINRWLAANCFGDYYTRNGLDLAQRELITFCFLMAPGRL